MHKAFIMRFILGIIFICTTSLCVTDLYDEQTNKFRQALYGLCYVIQSRYNVDISISNATLNNIKKQSTSSRKKKCDKTQLHQQLSQLLHKEIETISQKNRSIANRSILHDVSKYDKSNMQEFITAYAQHCPKHLRW